MRGRAALIIGAGAGYVLGTRAGRERYEQIKAQATRLWQDPRVQQKAAEAKDLAQEKAPQVKRGVAEATQKAAGQAKHAASGSETAVAAEPTTATPPPVVSPDPTTPVSAPTPGSHDV